MKKLLILSGKGGTGKTTIAASFIELLKAKAFADCDVDAPNLHLVRKTSSAPKKTDFHGSKKAEINKSKCVFCGRCRANCRFNAIKINKSKYEIDKNACEGCGVCELICPEKAIALVNDLAGDLMLFQDEAVFSTAKLKMGRGNSGKLVSQVKKQLDENTNADIAIIDGSPGIGCPVIASVSGVSMVLIVAEPSVSGISDMQRVLKTIKIFNVPVAVCINKYDTSPQKSGEIIDFCKENKIDFVGEIPYDTEVSKAVNEGKSIVEVECAATAAIKQIYNNTIKKLM